MYNFWWCFVTRRGFCTLCLISTVHYCNLTWHVRKCTFFFFFLAHSGIFQAKYRCTCNVPNCTGYKSKPNQNNYLHIIITLTLYISRNGQALEHDSALVNARRACTWGLQYLLSWWCVQTGSQLYNLSFSRTINTSTSKKIANMNQV